MKLTPALLSALIAAASTLAATGTAMAHDAAVHVGQPYVRATVPQQKSSGAFMTLQANHDARLVAVSSPVAERVEIHEMKMDGDVMRMRQIPTLALPAEQTVQLAPGGYHLMLMGLRQQLTAGETVPLTLSVDLGAGQTQELKVNAQVRPLGAASAGHETTGTQHGH